MAKACVMDEPQEQMPESRQLGQRLRAVTSAGNSTKHSNRDPRYLDLPVHRPQHRLALTEHERKDHMPGIDDPPTCVRVGAGLHKPDQSTELNCDA